MTTATTSGGAGEPPDPILTRLDAIDRRLDGLERHLGLQTAHPAAPARPHPRRPCSRRAHPPRTRRPRG